MQSSYARAHDAAVAFGSVHVSMSSVPKSKGRVFGKTPSRRPSVQLHVVRSGALSTRVRFAGDAADMFVEGQAFFTPSRDGVPMIAHRDTVALTLIAPAELADSLPRPETDSIRVESVLLEPIVDFTVRAMQIRSLEFGGFDTRHLEALLQQMVHGLLFESNSTSPAPLAKQNAFSRASSAMAERYADPALTAEIVAQEASVSQRQLQRLFRARGTTIQSELRRLRVAHACSLLRDRRYDAFSVDDIAKRVGLSSGSSLARAMSAAGLASPLQMRRESDSFRR